MITDTPIATEKTILELERCLHGLTKISSPDRDNVHKCRIACFVPQTDGLNVDIGLDHDWCKGASDVKRDMTRVADKWI